MNKEITHFITDKEASQIQTNRASSSNQLSNLSPLTPQTPASALSVTDFPSPLAGGSTSEIKVALN